VALDLHLAGTVAAQSRAAWDDGAHWYRCDLMVNRGRFQTRPARVTGSLRDNAAPITCLTWRILGDDLKGIEPSECDVPHQGELAGVFPVPEGADVSDRDTLRLEVQVGCLDAVYDFLGVDSLPRSLSVKYSLPHEESFEQWVVCLAAADDANRAFATSLRGLGAGPIPFA
jgi:hypothetical protein